MLCSNFSPFIPVQIHEFTSKTCNFEGASSGKGKYWNCFTVYQGIIYIEGQKNEHLSPFVFWFVLRDCNSLIAALLISSFSALRMLPNSSPEGNLYSEPILSSYASLPYFLELDMQFWFGKSQILHKSAS